MENEIEMIWDNGRKIPLEEYRVRIKPENIFDERIPREDFEFSYENLREMRARALGERNGTQST